MSKWRPKEGWEEERDRCIRMILNSVDTEEIDHLNIFEAGADVLLEATLPLLRQVYAQLCGFKKKLQPVSRRTALDDSIERLRDILLPMSPLGIPDEEEKG